MKLTRAQNLMLHRIKVEKKVHWFDADAGDMRVLNNLVYKGLVKRVYDGTLPVFYLAD